MASLFYCGCEPFVRGTATVTVKGLGDYDGMKTVKFKITAKLFDSFLKF